MRNLSRIKTLTLCVMLGALGCYKVEEPERKDELSSLKRELENALPEGGSMLAMAAYERPAAIKAVTWSMPDGGSLLIPYARDIANETDNGLPLAIHVGRDGRLDPIYAQEEGAPLFSVSPGAPPPAVIPCGDEALIRICNADDSTLWMTNLDSGTLRRSEAAVGDCKSTVLGRSLGGERFVSMRASSDTPVITEWSCDSGEVRESSKQIALPWMPALPKWIEEVEPSVYAWVRHQPGEGELDFGDWVYERSDGTGSVRVARTELPFPSDFDVTQSWERVRREPSGALLVDGVSGLYRWHVEKEGQIEQLGHANGPSPELSEWEYVGFGTAIASRSDWNPDGVQLEMPLEYEVLRLAGEGSRGGKVPTTPCVTREACRRIGESYLRGVIETASGPLGFYVMWTWQLHPVPWGETTVNGAEVAALVVAPLERSLP